MRSILTGLAIVAALTAPAAAQMAAPAPGQVRAIQSSQGRGLALVETSAGYRIEDRDGAAASLEVPPGTVLSSFQELAGGWIAAGNRWTDGGNELVLLRQRGRPGQPGQTGHRLEPAERLEPPPQGMDVLRTAPVPLIEKGRLAGLAWLEGDGGENNAVMAARWTGSDWDAVETVSPLTGEAQLALSAAVLDDGSGLLVWAAVDGEDDEVYWSHLAAGAWSAPERVHPDNGVPDIAPRVVAVAGGALVAWSQYDGKDYRLRVSRFAGGFWTDTGFVGEEGSLYPTLFATTGGAGFLYQTATPRSWSLLEVEADGRPGRRAATARLAGEHRPLVSRDEGETVRLRFAAQSAVEQPAPEPIPWHELAWIEQP